MHRRGVHLGALLLLCVSHAAAKDGGDPALGRKLADEEVTWIPLVANSPATGAAQAADPSTDESLLFPEGTDGKKKSDDSTTLVAWAIGVAGFVLVTLGYMFVIRPNIIGSTKEDDYEFEDLEDEHAHRLPAGWARVKSRSHEGQYSFLNVFTKERIEWWPTMRASEKPGNVPPPPGALPAGWVPVESTSRPGEMSYMNQFTNEKIEWLPTVPASKMPGRVPPPSSFDLEAHGYGNLDHVHGLPPHLGKLPEGWAAVNSTSRPGEVSYVNKHTGERIEWTPTVPASRTPGHVPPPSAEDLAKFGYDASHVQGVQTADHEDVIVLPSGWKAVPSSSRPGAVSFENIHTGERIQWKPSVEAHKEPGHLPAPSEAELKKLTQQALEPATAPSGIGGEKPKKKAVRMSTVQAALASQKKWQDTNREDVKQKKHASIRKAISSRGEWQKDLQAGRDERTGNIRKAIGERQKWQSSVQTSHRDLGIGEGSPEPKEGAAQPKRKKKKKKKARKKKAKGGRKAKGGGGGAAAEPKS